MFESIPSDFISATISNPRKKGLTKIVIRQIKNNLYQITIQQNNKAIHRNSDSKQIWDFIETAMLEYKQAIIHTANNDFHILMNRKNEPTILKKPPTENILSIQHNKTKNYLIPEGTPVPYLVKLGIMNPEGKVNAKKYDKFRQINRFLEFIRDILPSLPTNHKLHIVDFGCGKAYLTFAMHHYLTTICGYDVTIQGLDLKQDVVDHCQSLANEFGYRNLNFSKGDIKGFTTKTKVDMVVALHACDTATDAALYQAIKWGAEVILAVPCCQHELYSQIKNPQLQSILRHGILKERFAALATDAARADLLESSGYKTQIMEFIDLEHTPKNLLIRAIKHHPNPEAQTRYRTLKQTLSLNPTLETLLS